MREGIGYEDIESAMFADPKFRREVGRYLPVVAKLSNESLLALHSVLRDEIRKRAQKIAPKGRIGQ